MKDKNKAPPKRGKSKGKKLVGSQKVPVEGPLNEELARLKLEELDVKVDDQNQKRTTPRTIWREEAQAEQEKLADIMQKFHSIPPEQVTKGKDMALLSRADLGWRKAFMKERCSFLFKEVFPPLLRSGHVSPQEIYTCRLVSKATRKSVDQGLSQTFALKGCCFRILKGFTPILDKLEHVQVFNEWCHQSPSGTNPFFARKVAIGSGMRSPPLKWITNLQYWSEMESLLRHWGREIWQASIFFDRAMCPEDVYSQLHSFLVMMPNLRCLMVTDQHRAGENGKLISAMRPDYRMDLYDLLKKDMGNNPLPELPHLAYFCYNKFSPPPMIHGILTKFNHQLKYMCGKFVSDLLLPSQPLHVFRNMANCPPPATFEGSFPSLDELDLTYYDVERGSTVKSIFKNVNECGAGLQKLRMGFRNDLVTVLRLDGPTMKNLSLELPLLEYVEICLYRVNMANVDFLLPCRSLEGIYFRCTKSPPGKKKKGKKGKALTSAGQGETGSIQFMDYLGCLEQSNIWTLLPRLEKVVIEFKLVDEKFRTGLENLMALMPLNEAVTLGYHAIPKDPGPVIRLMYTRKDFLNEQAQRSDQDAP